MVRKGRGVWRAEAQRVAGFGVGRKEARGGKGRWGRRQGEWWYGEQGSEDAAEGRDGERWEGRVKEFRR